MEKINILGVPVDRVDMRQAVVHIAQAVEQDSKYFVVTPNSEIVVSANKDQRLLDIIKGSDMTVPDGIGLVLASKILKKPFRERVTGIDLMEELLKYAHKNHRSIFLLGGKPGVAKKAADNIVAKYPGLTLAGSHHGYFKGLHTGAEGHSEELAVIQTINQTKPDFIFVALGSPKQEYFIDKYLPQIDSKLFMGVGGSLDVYSGNVKRAPKIYQKLGLEWFYRGMKEPWRIKRMAVLPLFLLQVIVKKDKLIGY